MNQRKEIKQMNKVRPNKKGESGITLIALIVMIIILVILSAVAIRGITGQEGIINVSANAAEQHKIATYEERIEQNVRATVIAKGVLRKNSNFAET